LCEICYRWFNIEHGLILDPFAGGSVRGIVAAFLGYDYIGIDLRDKQVEENRIQAEAILKDGKQPTWIVGDALDIDTLCHDVQADFLFSCPPYFDLEQYSDDARDLSTMTYEAFKTNYRAMIQRSLSLLKPDRFACFVVGGIRDEQGVYRDFVSETIAAFTCNANVFLYNEVILVNPAGTLPIRCQRAFSGYRKLGKMHQNVLVFYKGDPKNIKSTFAEIEISKHQFDALHIDATHLDADDMQMAG
jgi:hypothetical protein